MMQCSHVHLHSPLVQPNGWKSTVDWVKRTTTLEAAVEIRAASRFVDRQIMNITRRIVK
jgi:hypothetical protein